MMKIETLRALLKKNRITPTERVRLLREANSLLMLAEHVLGTVEDSCQYEIDDLNNADVLTKVAEKRLNTLGDSVDKLADAVETLSNLNVPFGADVR